MDQIKEFGQTPSQLFDKPHPARNVKGARTGSGAPIPQAPSRAARASSSAGDIGGQTVTSEPTKKSRLGRLGGLTGKLPFKQIVSAVKGGFGIHKSADHDDEQESGHDGDGDGSVDADSVDGSLSAPPPIHLNPLRAHVEEVSGQAALHGNGDSDSDGGHTVGSTSAEPPSATLPSLGVVEEGSTPLPCFGHNTNALITVCA